ncbi:CoA-binding protein [Noviherbaspirillum cavernae]|uniref:CoA-binding protein n=1 Tax=Noviherbaspirillum cavernae TaxID=2320862 RepID=A0A418X547_9BURK|nr:CoA-binding protein [Noviherbaspirillum cavernae]RJG07603.1 CoA-binding protein [Noviherbaspirillum cavernae]
MSQLPPSIPELLANCRTIAVVGLSAKTNRPSHEVAEYLQAHGYRIIPVNPTYAGTHILGEHCHATLVQAAAALSEKGMAIDLVDCFRKSEDIPPIVEEAIAIGARCVWMQLGIVNQAAAASAGQAGLAVVMDKCLKIEHMQATQ